MDYQIVYRYSLHIEDQPCEEIQAITMSERIIFLLIFGRGSNQYPQGSNSQSGKPLPFWHDVRMLVLVID